MDNLGNSELYDHPLNRQVIGCAIEVHRSLGPGLLESTYQQCLAHELGVAKIQFKSQVALPVFYKGADLDCGYRLDFLVDDFLVVEIKSVDCITSLHQAQVLTYMKLSETPLGLILNFNVELLKWGIRKLATTDFSPKYCGR